MGAGRRGLTLPVSIAVSGLYAGLAGIVVFAAAELLNSDTTGPWFELAGMAGLGLAVLTAVLFVQTALLRRRERLTQRAWAWAAAAAAAGLVALAFVYLLLTILQVGPSLSGADVRQTRPVLHDLPLPPQASPVSESPGPTGTESILADFRVPDLSQVATFYRQALPAAGWSSEDATPNDTLLRYRKGEFVVIVVIDPSASSSEYTVTVDRVPAPALSPSPSGP